MKVSTRLIVLAALLTSIGVALGSLEFCNYPCNSACNVWGTQNFTCPDPPQPGFWKSLTDTAGQNANQCCLIAYSTSGNTGCQNAGSAITCQWQRTINYCDGTSETFPMSNSFQPQTPGGGSSC